MINILLVSIIFGARPLKYVQTAALMAPGDDADTCRIEISSKYCPPLTTRTEVVITDGSSSDAEVSPSPEPISPCCYEEIITTTLTEYLDVAMDTVDGKWLNNVDF